MMHSSVLTSHFTPSIAPQVAPGYVPDVTSYDYDAPITESGQVKDGTSFNEVLKLTTLYNVIQHF